VERLPIKVEIAAVLGSAFIEVRDLDGTAEVGAEVMLIVRRPLIAAGTPARGSIPRFGI